MFCAKTLQEAEVRFRVVGWIRLAAPPEPLDTMAKHGP